MQVKDSEVQATGLAQKTAAAPSAPLEQGVPLAQGVLLAQSVVFDPLQPSASLSQLPESRGIFALFGEDLHAEPYLAKASSLRGRLRRFLSPAPSQSRRLQLAERIRRIEWTESGSDFASDLILYQAARAFDGMYSARGRDAKTRLRLRPAAFLKVRMENRFPRAVVTTRSAAASATEEPVGPFPSKAFAERYLEQVLDLFLLRRCMENLVPNPAHPGCVYSEMKKCLAPCFAGCTDNRYADEARAVNDFFRTRGHSLLEQVAAARTQAADALEFENAAALHQRYEKVKAVADQMPEAARPLNRLSGIIVQPGITPERVDLFELAEGRLAGPVSYATLGMRLHNELSGSSSLFTQPMALEPVLLDEAGGDAAIASVRESSRDMLEVRLEEALTALRQASSGASTGARKRLRKGDVEDHLSLFARWYYRPQTRRIGEMLFVNSEGTLPRRPLLRAISRVAASVQFGAGAPGAKPSKWHA